MSNTIKVCCPNCEHEFTVDVDQVIATGVEKEIRLKLEEDFKQRLQQASARAKQEAEDELRLLRENMSEKEKKLKELSRLELEKKELENKMKTMQEQAEIDAMKKLADKERQIKEDAEKLAKEKAALEFLEKERQMKNELERLELEKIKAAQDAADKARSEEQIRVKELQEKLDKQMKLAEEMKRKAEQGSMQSQGEILELEMERMLRDMYPYDEITEVKKGQRGADVIQRVRTMNGVDCGSIYYEVKRTKTFEEDWIKKLKDDNLQLKADILVIATEAMPKGENRFYFKDGVWVCAFTEAKALSLVLRYSLLQTQNLKITLHGRESKAELLYNFVTSIEFKSQLEAILEGFADLQKGYNKERMQLQKIWKEREKQLEKILSNAIGFYGAMKGIAGASVPDIKMLEEGGEGESE
ncbi:MAG: DUF2130 domain-containing protein [Bacteroidia bacterium]